MIIMITTLVVTCTRALSAIEFSKNSHEDNIFLPVVLAPICQILLSDKGRGAATVKVATSRASTLI